MRLGCARQVCSPGSQQGPKALSCLWAPSLCLLTIKNHGREGTEQQNISLPSLFPSGSWATTNGRGWESVFCNLSLWHPDEGTGCAPDLPFSLWGHRHCVVWVFFLPGILPGGLGLERVSPGLLFLPQRWPWVRGEVPSTGRSEVLRWRSTTRALHKRQNWPLSYSQFNLFCRGHSLLKSSVTAHLGILEILEQFDFWVSNNLPQSKAFQGALSDVHLFSIRQMTLLNLRLLYLPLCSLAEINCRKNPYTPGTIQGNGCTKGARVKWILCWFHLKNHYEAAVTENQLHPPPFIYKKKQSGAWMFQATFYLGVSLPSLGTQWGLCPRYVRAILLLLVDLDGKSQAQKGLSDLVQLAIIYEP